MRSSNVVNMFLFYTIINYSFYYACHSLWVNLHAMKTVLVSALALIRHTDCQERK